MSKVLPPHPNLTQLKKQAKDLLNGHAARSKEAFARIRTHYPKLLGATDATIGAADFALQDAQLVIAREVGFESWPKLRAFVESDLDEIVLAATGEEAELVRQAAPLLSAALIVGESGTGKELVARAIHERSPRRDRPFFGVHCGSLPDVLLQSDLFGHQPGAFTGANDTRKGRFELAEGGTVFLDEAEKIAPQVQTRLLRLLRDGDFERLGSAESLSADVRVIAATQADLAEAVETGCFNRDLYHRLNAVSIRLAPLRERPHDIPRLARHFIRKKAQTTGKSVRDIEPAALDLLAGHPYPGNVRELESLIERAFVRCDGSVIGANHLPEEFASA